MSKRELVLNAFDNKKVARVPVGFWFHFVPEGLFDDEPSHIKRNIEGHQAYFDTFQPDFLKLMSDGYFTYPLPGIKDVRTIADLKNLRAEGVDEWIEKQVKLVKELTSRFGKEVVTFYNIFAPATYVKFELEEFGGVPFAKLVDEDPQAVKEVLDEFAKDIAALSKAVITEGGADGIYLSTQNVQGAHLSKEEYLKYIAPSDLTVLKAANEASDYNILHICGYEGAKNDLSTYVDYPAKIVNWAAVVENVSLEEGKKLFGGRAVIGGFGNTEESILYKGTKEEIQEYTVNLLKNAGTTGVILGADCTIPGDTPYEHLEWVREAAKEFTAD